MNWDLKAEFRQTERGQVLILRASPTLALDKDGVAADYWLMHANAWTLTLRAKNGRHLVPCARPEVSFTGTNNGGVIDCVYVFQQRFSSEEIDYVDINIEGRIVHISLEK